MPTTHRGSRRRRARSIVINVGEESTVHGLARVVTARNKLRRIAWAIFVMAGFVVATIHVSWMVKKYLAYSAVEINGILYTEVKFPSVTVCSINPISSKKQTVALKHEMKQWKTFVSGLNSRLRFLQGLYDNTHVSLLTVDINDLIVHCTFDEQECSATNFTLFVDRDHYYSCYTFNTVYNTSGLIAKQAGPHHGLSLILDLDDLSDERSRYFEPYNFGSNIENSVGIRVDVHGPNTIPLLATHGFDVTPGFTTSVSLKASVRTQLPEPHGECINDVNSDGHTYKPTIESCLQICVQERVVNTCGCKASQLPEPKNSKKFTYCGALKGWRELHAQLEERVATELKKSMHGSQKDFLNVYMKMRNDLPSFRDLLKNVTCEMDVLDKFHHNDKFKQSCRCHLPCSGLFYQKSLSQSYWPSEYYNHDLITKLRRGNKTRLTAVYNYIHEAEKQFHGDTKVSKQEEELREKASKLIHRQLIRLNIYMESLVVMEYKQVPSYGIGDLLADIGGSLGLWMGISVLSCLEFAELAWRLVLWLLHGEILRNMKKNDAEESS